MEKHKKCSAKKHVESYAISYCVECQLYMCNKCSNHHSEFYEDHHKYELEKDKNEIFTGLCKEEKHKIELEYYCQNHNILCCAACISKIKGKGNGQHTDCNVCYIEDIEKEKKNELKENMKYLEDFSNNIDNLINELKKIYEKINENKEEIKMNISKIFTNIRNAINEREDELLLNIDNKFNELFFNEEFIKKSEKLQNDIKINLEKGKKIEIEWNKNLTKLNLCINECINIENNIHIIKKMKEHINNFNSMDIKLNFIPKLNENIKILEDIKHLGDIIIEDKNNIYIYELFNSSIIKNNKEYNKTLKIWINKNKEIKAELLYRLSRDGDEISKFHELCDDKGPTLILFQVEEDIAGIYTPLSWDIKSDTKSDIESFMFNLNKNEKYLKVNKNTSIFCKETYGPWTFSFGFYKTYQMKKIQHGGNNINEGYDGGSRILPNNSQSTKLFDVQEVEVYKIIENKIN